MIIKISVAQPVILHSLTKSLLIIGGFKSVKRFKPLREKPGTFPDGKQLKVSLCLSSDKIIFYHFKFFIMLIILFYKASCNLKFFSVQPDFLQLKLIERFVQCCKCSHSRADILQFFLITLIHIAEAAHRI